jgi:cytochrome d ubiquinol oxidase subunit I
MLDPIILSRIQFAFTLSFHILFPTLTIGLALYLVVWETAWLRTKKEIYYQLCRFWTKIFALAFGMGVVSGIVLAYEFGTNFSRFSEAAGNVIGPLMSYEVLTAFFLEAGFLGVMLFGWRRVHPAIHYASTLMVALGTLFSAFWILSANSWLQTPTGYRYENGIFYVGNWLNIIFNPSFPYRLMHMVVASFLSSSLLIAGIAAWYLIKRQHLELAQTTFKLTILVVAILAPLQFLLGDLHGLNTLKHQPMKIAAMEGRWHTEQNVPLTLFAIPDMSKQENRFAVDIPRLGSLILTHSLNGEVKGLNEVAAKDRPYVPIVFYSFRVMLFLGVLFILTGLIALYLYLRKRLLQSPGFWRWCVWLSPFGFVAVIAGWFTTETGRQPWIIYGMMRTVDGASLLPGSSVLITLIAFIILYFVLLGTFIFYLVRLVKKGPDLAVSSNIPDRLTAWLEKQP